MEFQYLTSKVMNHFRAKAAIELGNETVQKMELFNLHMAFNGTIRSLVQTLATALPTIYFNDVQITSPALPHVSNGKSKFSDTSKLEKYLLDYITFVENMCDRQRLKYEFNHYFRHDVIEIKSDSEAFKELVNYVHILSFYTYYLKNILNKVNFIENTTTDLSPYCRHDESFFTKEEKENLSQEARRYLVRMGDSQNVLSDMSYYTPRRLEAYHDGHDCYIELQDNRDRTISIPKVLAVPINNKLLRLLCSISPFLSVDLQEMGDGFTTWFKDFISTPENKESLLALTTNPFYKTTVEMHRINNPNNTDHRAVNFNGMFSFNEFRNDFISTDHKIQNSNITFCPKDISNKGIFSTAAYVCANNFAGTNGAGINRVYQFSAVGSTVFISTGGDFDQAKEIIAIHFNEDTPSVVFSKECSLFETWKAAIFLLDLFEICKIFNFKEKADRLSARLKEYAETDFTPKAVPRDN